MGPHIPRRAWLGWLQPAKIRRSEFPECARLAFRYISQRAARYFEAIAGRRDKRCKLRYGARTREYLGRLRGRPGRQRRPGYRVGLHLRQGRAQGQLQNHRRLDRRRRGAGHHNRDGELNNPEVWAKDYAQFQDKKVGAHAFFMVDWSRGADGVIGKQGINSIEDLAGKTVAFAPYTPSHFLLWNGLKSSGLTTEQRNEIFSKAVHTKDGIEPATLFAQQKVDAAVAWDPDMSDAVTKRPGSRKIYDTRIANHLIADILVVSDRFASRCPQTVVKLVQGWLEGVEFIKAQPNRAHTLIGTIKDFNIPEDLAKTMLGGVKLADYADNKAFFGMRGADTDYTNIFKMAQEMYHEDR